MFYCVYGLMSEIKNYYYYYYYIVVIFIVYAEMLFVGVWSCSLCKWLFSVNFD